MSKWSPELRELLERTIVGFDECVQALAATLDQPARVKQRDLIALRHLRRGDLLLSIVKLVKIASHHNAAMVLLGAGYVQEVYALCRMIDEACEDITFMATPLGEGGGASENQQRFFQEFFQEEFTDREDLPG